LDFVRKFIPRPAQPEQTCAKYLEDEWFECVWDGVAPFVGAYIDQKIEEMTYENYWALLKAKLLQVEGILSAAREDRDACPDCELGDLARVESDMRGMNTYFVKPGAPFQSSVYLAAWGSLHLFVRSYLTVADPVFSSPGHKKDFKELTYLYMDALNRSIYNGFDMRMSLITNKTRTTEETWPACSSQWTVSEHCDGHEKALGYIEVYDEHHHDAADGEVQMLFDFKVLTCQEASPGSCGVTYTCPDYPEYSDTTKHEAIKHDTTVPEMRELIDNCEQGGWNCFEAYRQKAYSDTQLMFFRNGAKMLHEWRAIALTLE